MALFGRRRGAPTAAKNNDVPKLLFWTTGPAALGALFFVAVRLVKGEEATQVYKEIPPE